jgi:hypothetical protein
LHVYRGRRRESFAPGLYAKLNKKNSSEFQNFGFSFTLPSIFRMPAHSSGRFPQARALAAGRMHNNRPHPDSEHAGTATAPLPAHTDTRTPPRPAREPVAQADFGA